VSPKAQPIFRIDSTTIHGSFVRLDAHETHHLHHVLRLRPGDSAGLIDEQGRNHNATVVLIDRVGALMRIFGVAAPRAMAPLILAIAIIKGPRMDFAIEKAVELGASEIWPVLCARCVVRDPGRERLLRWRRLAVAASKQSLRARAVELGAPLAFAEMLTRLPGGMLPLFCQAQAPPLASIARRATRGGILIACGPEGDFDAEELAAAERAGFVRASLGPNRLRTETAALAALAIAGTILDEVAQGD
jgi:16S rRNA (uracil1498-N3)-methyltransferase